MKKKFIHYYTFLLSVLFLSPLSFLGQVGYGPAPYCLPQYSNKPCNQPNPSNTAGNSINDFIDSFNTTGGTGNITNNNSGCNTQTISSVPENYMFVACPQFLRCLPGQNITCNFMSGIIFYQGFAVYIDWNKDNTFAFPGEQVCSPPGTPAAATWTSAVFTVPATQAVGTYTMRVRCAYATAGPSVDPCALFSFGEAEDYRVVVGTSTICPVLPVNVMSYSGLYRNGVSELGWTTATEKNADYFLIEKSYDNQNFELVGKVKANGNSNTEKDYFMNDRSVKSNTIIYYRLRMFDYGNIESYSNTVTLFTSQSNIGFETFPNPVNDELNLVTSDILFGKGMYFDIIDVNGTVVKKMNEVVGDGSHININLADLNPGPYFIRLSDETGILSKKLVVKQ